MIPYEGKKKKAAIPSLWAAPINASINRELQVLHMAHILSSLTGSKVDLQPITRALLSVSDKTGLLDLARALASHNVELLSTGGTAKVNK